MSLRVSGKNMDIGEAIRERAEERVSNALSRFFDNRWSGHVTVMKEGYGFRTDCAIHIDSGTILHTDATAGDAYSSVDLAIIKLEKRLSRYKKRLRDNHHGQRLNDALPVVEVPYYVVETPQPEAEEVKGDYAPVIVAETTTRLDELSVSDAVIRLDMTGAPVVVFRHAGHGRVNLVYRRPDGNVGWVDPPVNAA
jgi:ribosomal subunit interface protein